jgi:hypothetical protein
MKPVQMRMARAFIASVPMGIVLVAALVVPLAVIPGTFGFDRWPSSTGDRVTEQQVRLAPPKVDVVAVRPRRDVPERQPALVAARPQPARPASTVVAVAPAPRRTVVRTPTPAPTRPDRPQPAPTPAPQQPAAPAPATQEQPAKDDSGLLAGGNVPVARELPPQESPAPEPAPAPAPEPVQQPVERVAAPEPCHGGGQGRGHHGDGDSQQ